MTNENTKKDKQLQAIEYHIRMESLHDKETTDMLVNAAIKGGELMRKMKNDVFLAMLDSVNYNAFPDMESYVSFLKECVKGNKTFL